MLSPLESALLALLLVLLMFGMGATLRREHFVDVVRHPRAFLIGTASQFGWMPLLAFGLAKGLDLPASAAIGLIVMGTCPGGATSNLFAHLARADIALSVSMTAASKLIGVVMMPVCLFLYARPFTSATLTIPYGDIAKTLVVLLLPVVLAMVLSQRFGPRFAQRAEKIGSLSGLLVLVILIGVSLVRNAGAFATISPRQYLAAIALGALGMLLGDLAARLARLPRAQRRTVSFETGIQNSPLCFAILLSAFPGEAQSELLELPLLYALFVLVEASLVTLYYRLHDAREAGPQPRAATAVPE